MNPQRTYPDTAVPSPADWEGAKEDPLGVATVHVAAGDCENKRFPASLCAIHQDE